MRKPVIGIIGSAHLINEEYLIHGAGQMNSAAVAHVAGGVPLIVPTEPELFDLDDLMAACDGFVFTGARPNVHPSEYGHDETEAHGTFDHGRDGVSLPLVRKCVERGQPIVGICRGFQEVAVAMGCTLHPEIRDLPGRDNHRMPPDGTLEEKFAMRHIVKMTEGGVFHRLFGKSDVMTNSLHGQGIDQVSSRVVVDGVAPDGTAEAIYVRDAPGFTLSVQWHPEYQADIDPVSRRLFQAFGEAACLWAEHGRVLRQSA